MEVGGLEAYLLAMRERIFLQRSEFSYFWCHVRATPHVERQILNIDRTEGYAKVRRGFDVVKP
jgi:hypothetical protein